MSRPRVSDTNLERIQKYSGGSFDDKLGALLTIHAVKCNEADRLSAQLEVSREFAKECSSAMINYKKAIIDWKTTAILTGVGLVCALGYIGWML